MDKSSRQQLQTALTEGTLLSERELDALAVPDADAEVVAPFGAATSGDKTSSKKHALGAAGKSVPKEVHERMQALYLSGGVPPTNLGQRERTRLTGGTNYAVPSALKEALEYGYIHPNLAPPSGYRWSYHGGNWRLVLRGG